MKNSSFLLVLLGVALLFIAYRWAYSSEGDSKETAECSTIEDIMTRTSVRSYTDRNIGKETVDTLLRAAMAAPTAMNKQPWRFVVIDKREILDSIAGKFKSMTMAAKAPLAIVMCGDMNASIEGAGRDFWVQDVSAASENLLLAAHAVGLGAVWCGIYPSAERVEDFSKMLQLPETIIPMACICIGYPDGENQPKDKWKPEYIHYNGWK
ncbi:MAG: nitroreductase family protein [Muribaculaceae bacterium]|nr:nitroreductase family protein [Muribaculaceae bacterium]